MVGLFVAAHFEVEDCFALPAFELEVDVRPRDVDDAHAGDIKPRDDRIVQVVLHLYLRDGRVMLGVEQLARGNLDPPTALPRALGFFWVLPLFEAEGLLPLPRFDMAAGNVSTKQVRSLIDTWP
jgi:hypothetical protein